MELFASCIHERLEIRYILERRCDIKMEALLWTEGMGWVVGRIVRGGMDYAGGDR